MTHEEVAEKLLTPIWRGIPTDYKAKYARNIWQQFEDNIRSAAYTARASDFLSKIKTRLGVELYEGDARLIVELVSSGNDKQLLKMLRDDTTLLVLLVRVANEERKEAYQQKQAAKKGAKVAQQGACS